MSKRFIPALALVLMAALEACSGSSGAPATPTLPAADTPVAVQNTPTTTSPTASGAPAASTPSATTPAPTPDFEKVLNAQPDDWTQGPPDARVTFIEWGDFQ